MSKCMNQLLMIQYQVIRNDTTKQEIKGLENIYILGSISEEYCLSHNGIRNSFKVIFMLIEIIFSPKSSSKPCQFYVI